MILRNAHYILRVLTQFRGNPEISVFSVSHTDSEESNQAGPRYLRIEANAFHPSEMSLGSTIDIVATTSTDLTAQDSTNSVPMESKVSLDSSDPNSANVTDGEVIGK